jgi:geranylgeranyl diphosphate synthase type I
MNLSDAVQLMRPAVEETLQHFVARSLPASYPDLSAMLSYHMGWEGEGAGSDAQGKRIRPLLVLLSAQAAGGAWQDALPAAAAVELLHNFSLVHDDIQDNSPLRRNRPTVWVKWGTAQAINAGDVLFTLSFLALQDLQRTHAPGCVLQASRTLQETCLRLTEGQYLDISFERRASLPLEEYWLMIGGKTSALLSCCTELGALVAGMEGARLAAFRSYGYALGLAFQVLDDWLGIWGDPAVTGKSVASDLVSAKKTLPVLYGLAQNGPFATRWLSGGISAEEAPALAHMLEAEGAAQYTLDAAARLTSEAVDALDQAAAGSPASEALRELTHALLKRKN